MSAHFLDQFRSAMQAAGVPAPEKIIDDGKLHRFRTNGKAHDDAGWYLLHGDGIPAGAFGCWRSGVSETFRADIGRELTPEEARANRERMESLRRDREAERERRQVEARQRAQEILATATPAPEDHEYLRRKGIKSNSLRVHEGALVVPMRDERGLCNLQLIYPDGAKRFLPGGKVSGAYHEIGEVSDRVVLCEGAATGYSIQNATGLPVRCAMSAGNLTTVARLIRQKSQSVEITIAGDNDENGTGQRAAAEAAEAVSGRLAIPSATPADWNDVAVASGLDAVRAGIESASAVPTRESDDGPATGPPEDEEIPLEAYESEPTSRPTAGMKPARQPPIAWDSLEGREPPQREWVVPYWVPARHTTLLSGRAGVGKTLVGQHVAAALALGFEYIEPLEPRRVLMWAGEDDEAELWRRQVQISHWMAKPLSALTERFFMHSYAGTDITLMVPVFGALMPTPMLAELREQVADYRAEVVILDNIARLYGASENDRHAVTTFCAVVQGACAPAAVILLGHPAKAAGSEYSGSTAWEGAVRARLYLSDRPPDQDPSDDDAPADDTVRYLSRRKANYSARDIRKFSLVDGVLIPAAIESARQMQPGGEFLKDTVRRAVQTLAARGIHGTASTASSNYLPRLAKQYRLLDAATEKAFAAAMREMVLAGDLVSREVGRTSDRHPRSGLVLP